MVSWEELMDWGYGYFSCTAGEHLNKIIKTMEVEHTNLSANRFETIVQNISAKQFNFSSSNYLLSKRSNFPAVINQVINSTSRL